MMIRFVLKEKMRRTILKQVIFGPRGGLRHKKKTVHTYLGTWTSIYPVYY